MPRSSVISISAVLGRVHGTGALCLGTTSAYWDYLAGTVVEGSVRAPGYELQIRVVDHMRRLGELAGRPGSQTAQYQSYSTVDGHGNMKQHSRKLPLYPLPGPGIPYATVFRAFLGVCTYYDGHVVRIRGEIRRKSRLLGGQRWVQDRIGYRRGVETIV
jgi:hypothetical protein